MSERHAYFTVQSTSCIIRDRGALAIYCGDAPQKNGDGTTSFSLSAPLLLMPSEMFEDAEDVMEKVARVLNENAHVFFDSAKPADVEAPPVPASENPFCSAVSAEAVRALVAALNADADKAEALGNEEGDPWSYGQESGLREATDRLTALLAEKEKRI